jgi:glycosyltransferase involved in cell wall biosynthesis
VKINKILAIGQTPPPFHGQAMMINRFVKADFKDIKVYHIRSSFSDSVDQIGKASVGKIFHLFYIIYKTYIIFFKYRPTILVIYPITNSRSGILKDNILLFFIRWLFKKTVFYFRSAGLIHFVTSKSKFEQFILTLFTKNPDLCILLDKGNPPDNEILFSKKVLYVPNGIEDSADIYPLLKVVRNRNPVFNCLYIGLLTEDKGVLDLIQAIQILVNDFKITDIKLTLIGKSPDKEFENALKDKITSLNLETFFDFKGQMVASDKWSQFIQSDVLCFPTYYENESFGNVILEGFLSSLPVIATDWRGIPNIVDDSENGLIVPIRSPKRIADSIHFLYSNEEVRLKMANSARRKYERNYKLESHLNNLEQIFCSL